MLASLLYPYDDDARDLIPGWLAELDDAGCIRLYEVEGNTYLDIPKWLNHQKIDRPSASKFPSFDEGSRAFAEPSRKIAQDQGPRTKDRDQGPGEEGKEVAPAPALPLDEAVHAYNATAEQAGWAKVQRLTAPRTRALTLRLTEAGGIAGWQCAMAKAAASKFLTGKTPRSNGHANWRPDFDWFTTASNFTKLMEGSYDNAPNSQQQPERGLAAALAALAE